MVLTGPKDWVKWKEITKSTASKEDIWQYLDPDTDEGALPTLIEPEMPTPSSVKLDILVTPTNTPGFTPNSTQASSPQTLTNAPPTYRPPKFSKLDADEREELKTFREGWSYNRKLYDRQAEALRGRARVIQGTIDPKFLIYTYDEALPNKFRNALALCADFVVAWGQKQGLLRPVFGGINGSPIVCFTHDRYFCPHPQRSFR